MNDEHPSFSACHRGRTPGRCSMNPTTLTKTSAPTMTYATDATMGIIVGMTAVAALLIALLAAVVGKMA